MLDVKPFCEFSETLIYELCGTRGVPLRATAFSCSRSLRITATTATLPAFPRWRRL